MAIRRLPLRVAPLPGEAIDSWLEAIAYRYETRWKDFHLALGAVLPAKGSSDVWVLRLTETQTEAISAATELDAAALHAMTLADYPAIAIGVNPSTRRPVSEFPWRNVNASRFCPMCLAATGGRWKLVWRMVWFFACPTHRCLLAHQCPECGGAPHVKAPAALVPKSGRCSAGLPTESVTSTPPRCGADLAKARVVQLDRDHPALAAQSILADAIVGRRIDFGIYRGSSYPVGQVLSDIRALGRYFLSGVDSQILDALAPSDIVSEYVALPQQRQVLGRWPSARASPAASTAVAVTSALSILGQRDIASAVDVVRSVWPGTEQPLFSRTADGKGHSVRPVSTELRAIQLMAIEPRLPASEQLRCRLGTALPRRPTRNVADAELAAAYVPTLFWPKWWLRMVGPQFTRLTARPALSVALLLVDNDLAIADAVKLLDCPLSTENVIETLNRLKRADGWANVRQALYRLSDYLRTNTPPIDYRRRRRLDYTSLLPSPVWAAICRRTRTRPEGLTTARGYLFERLSSTFAMNPPVTPCELNAAIRLRRFPTRLTPELNDALIQYSMEFLAKQGITDEVLQWNPPTDLLRGLELPSDGTDGVDIARLHGLIRSEGVSTLGVAATELRTSVDTVRLTLENHPAPRQRLLPALPTRERFVQLYNTDGLTLTEMAAATGVPRETLARLAEDYGIPRRRGGRREYFIDRQWLYDQYVIERRSFPDLARERGMKSETLANRAQRYGIPTRRLSRYNPMTLSSTARIPTVLVPALATQGGWERLQRLPVLAQHDSISDTAAHLGMDTSTLANTVKRVERDLGGAIFFRSTCRRRPQRLTPLGKRVVAAVNDLVAVGGPDGEVDDACTRT